MAKQPFELAEGWPHKHLGEFPEEVHINPRTAYFTQDGKVMALRLEELTADEAKAGFELIESEKAKTPQE